LQFPTSSSSSGGASRTQKASDRFADLHAERIGVVADKANRLRYVRLMTTSEQVFADRSHAGRALAARLLQRGLLGRTPQGSPLARVAPPVVLALPRGGVPVGFEIARALDAPLDVLLVRKIGAPGNPELGLGAVAEGGVRVLSDEVILGLHVSEQDLERSTARALTQMRMRAQRYRADRDPVSLRDSTAIVVDDGLATGGTARAAICAARARGASQVVLAAPVGARSTAQSLRSEADEVICLLEPEPMWAIGMWYRDFSQVPDEQVLALLASAHERVEAGGRASDPPA
jgi:putative phosphoribosyl transferase